MGILIDIIFIAIILLSAFLGYKKGLVNMASKLFAGILAIIITLILYQPVSNAIIKNTPLHLLKYFLLVLLSYFVIIHLLHYYFLLDFLFVSFQYKDVMLGCW